MELVCSVANVTNEEIAATMKSDFDRARQAMEMRPLFESKRQWEFAFGDVGDIQDNDEEGDDCSKIQFSNGTLTRKQTESLQVSSEDKKRIAQRCN